MSKTVWIATYEHRYGDDTCIFTTLAGALAWKRQLGATYWESERLGPMPGPEVDIGDAYFDAMLDLCRGEYFRLQESEFRAETMLTPLESRLRCILQEKYGVNTAEEALRLALEAEQYVRDCGPGDPATLYFANSQRDLETLAFLIEKEKHE